VQEIDKDIRQMMPLNMFFGGNCDDHVDGGSLDAILWLGTVRA